jgi:transposase
VARDPLLPGLRPGDIVVMDNLASTTREPPFAKRSAAPEPSCSSDLNPIEQVFAKLKHLLRNAAARNSDTVCAAIGQLLDSFTPAECASYFANSLEPENIPL